MRSVLMIRLTSIVVFRQALERFVSSFQMRPEIGFVMLLPRRMTGLVIVLGLS